MSSRATEVMAAYRSIFSDTTATCVLIRFYEAIILYILPLKINRLSVYVYSQPRFFNVSFFVTFRSIAANQIVCRVSVRCWWPSHWHAVWPTSYDCPGWCFCTAVVSIYQLYNRAAEKVPFWKHLVPYKKATRLRPS